jgi:hypothetical protein
LLPDLDYGCGAAPDPNLLGRHGILLDASRGTALRFYSGTTCIAEAPLERLYSQYTGDLLFDDLLLADQNGRVVYQRSKSSPRIAALKDLIAPVDPNAQGQALPRQGKGSDADMTTEVLLDGSLYQMLVQPLRITVPGSGSPDLEWVICGLLQSSRASVEARHVAPKWLLWIFGPLLFMALSGPFLKLMLLKPTGRLAFRDVILLTAFTVCAAGFIALFLLSGNYYWLRDETTDAELKALAKKLDANIATDFGRMWRVLQAFDAVVPPSLPALPEEKRDRIDLLGAQSNSLPPALEKKNARFDFVFWTTANGCQAAKWTTKQRITGRVAQQRRPHFQNVIARRFWTLREIPGSSFTVQPLISPTTSEFIVVLSAVSGHRGLKLNCGGETALEAASIIASPHSLVRPLLPPGMGFAVIEPDGQVLFHSTVERNLHENLFEEIRSPEQLRARVATHTSGELSAYYRGLKHRFHVRPLNGMAGSPWTLVVFRELEPRQALIGLVWLESSTLFLLMLAALSLAWAAASVTMRLRGWTFREQVDWALSVIWPDPARSHAYRRIALLLGIAVAASLAAIVAGVKSSSGGVLLMTAAAGPVATFALCIYGALAWKDNEGSKNYLPRYVTALFLGLMLTGVIPMKALFLLCHQFEADLEIRGWQLSLAKQAEQRQRRLVAELESEHGLSEAAKAYIRAHILPQRLLDEHGYAAARLQTEVTEVNAADAPILPGWWETWLGALRPPVLEQAIEAGNLVDGGGAWQWTRGSGGRLVLSRGDTPWSISSVTPTLGFPDGILWWLIVAALLSCAYAWIRASISRLYLAGFQQIPLPRLADLPPPGECATPLLVLGLPLAKKDNSVRVWLGYTPPRINLHLEEFRENWVDSTVERMERELAAQRTALGAGTPMAAVAAAGTDSLPVSLVAEPRPYHPWVHISNLEAKLDDAAQRSTVLKLLERLLTMDSSGEPVHIAVTSAVDPLFHFDTLITGGKKPVYDSPLPDPELQRWARVLSNFRKVQPAAHAAKQPGWAQTDWGEPIWEECRNHPALQEIALEIVSTAPGPIPTEAALARIEERALAFYKLIWSACTRPEKLLLVQLAQTGMVNPRATGTLQELVRKGVIELKPQPRIMNETFRHFLETAEAPDTVKAWEREAGESPWLIIRNVVVGLTLIALVVLAATQNQTLQSATAVISAATAALAGLFRAVEYFVARRQPQVVESA